MKIFFTNQHSDSAYKHGKLSHVKIYRAIFFFLLITVLSNPINAQYCSVGSSATCDEYIYNFSLNTIDNTTSCTVGGYAPYTSQTTSLIKGQTYTATVTPAIISSATIPTAYTNDEIAVWIDYNGDYDFNDLGERIGYLFFNGNTQYEPFTFTVPLNANTGLVRLRARISYASSGAIVPCGIVEYGETEDYTVNIVSNSSPPASPTSINASTSTVCPGATSTLSANGATGITYWFSGSCANTISSSIGSGSSINVSPTSTTTYYARNYSNGAWSNNCASTTISVATLPSSPGSPTSNSPQCQFVTLTRSGTPSGGVTWYWQGTNSNGTSTSLGSGATYSASSTGTYYIRARNSSGCWSQNSAGVFAEVSGLPAAPPTISSNSPNCGSVLLLQPNAPPSGVAYFWQGTNPNGTSTSFPGNSYSTSASGTYYQRARNSLNCWSQASTSTIVEITTSSVNNIFQSACGSYTWFNGVTYTNSTQAQIVWDNAAAGGCDSIFQLNLTVHPEYSVTDEINACESYTWINGVTYTQNNNSAVYLLQSEFGCDSLVRLDLTFGAASDTTYLQASALGSYQLNNIVYTQSGVFIQDLQNQFGCDSTIQLNLFVEPASTENLHVDSKGLIYPNPSEDGVFKINPNIEFRLLFLKNSLGQNIQVKVEDNIIYLSDLPKGIYFACIDTGASVYCAKLIYK
jgi:hypothetical protein